MSIVIRVKDQAPRLRLTLASLTKQTVPAEVVLVDDGSVDGTPEVLAEAADTLRMVTVRHDVSRGTSAASNAGAHAAGGAVVIFLDGDTLAHPELVARHLAAHAARPGLVGRGETFHLRQTRAFLDPEAATPLPGQEARVAAMTPAERQRLRVTRAEILDDFAAIDRRASPGVYPGAGPRALYELEVEALRDSPGCTVLWAAASGSNLSISRRAFLGVGGFDQEIRLGEHRELALRLTQGGAQMGFVPGARTYHMTHRDGWSGHDPLRDPAWEDALFRRHPLPAVRLLAVLWASLMDPSPVPAPARLLSLPALERAAQDWAAGTGLDYGAARRAIPGFAA